MEHKVFHREQCLRHCELVVGTVDSVSTDICSLCSSWCRNCHTTGKSTTCYHGYVNFKYDGGTCTFQKGISKDYSSLYNELIHDYPIGTKKTLYVDRNGMDDCTDDLQLVYNLSIVGIVFCSIGVLTIIIMIIHICCNKLRKRIQTKQCV